MLDINVKTIDGQNRSYSVPDNYTVKQFKEKIANSLSIPIERQRLIFQGRELKDTNSLSEFDVNGKTLHLVQRVPPTVGQPQPQQQQAQSQSTNTGGATSPDVTQLIQNLIGGLGEFGQNATFNTTTANDGTNGMEVHIDLSNVSQLVNENEIRSRIRNIRRFLSLAQSRLNRLEEIQSGAPLDDTSNSSIIVGSIHGTASLSDANGSIGTIGFDINHLPLNNLPASILQQIPGLATLGTNQSPRQQQQQLPTQQTINTTNITNTPPSINTTTAAPSQPNLINIHSAAVQAAAAAAAAQAANIHEAAVRAALSSAPQPHVHEEHTNAANLAHTAALNAAQSHANSLSHMFNIQLPGTATTSTTTTTTTTRNEDGTETSTTTTTSSNSNENTPNSTTDNNNSTNTLPSAATQPEPARTQAQPQPESQSIGVEVLGELIQSVMDSYSRFLPYLQHYHTMLINDESEPPESPPSSSSTSSAAAASNLNVINNNNTNIIVLGGGDNRRQRFCNNINDMMHLLGHLFHNLSDLHINIRDRPPRQMHTMNSMQHSASTIISAAVPIEANIQIPFPPAPPPPPTNTDSQSERLAQFRQRHRSSQSLSGDSTTTSTGNATPRIPSSVSSSSNANTTPSSSSSTNDATEATDIPIPLPFTLSSNQRSSSIDTRANTNVPPSPGGVPLPTQLPIPPPLTRIFRPNLTGIRAPGQGLPFSLPPLQYSTMNSYDQFLPCNSVHFYNTINPLLQNNQQTTTPSSHPNQTTPGESGRWRVGAPNRPRARMPAAAFSRYSFNPNEETLSQANQTNSSSQRRRHPAGDQTTSTTNSTTSAPNSTSTTTSQSGFPNIGGLNQLIGNILASNLNRTQPNSESQHIRVNIGGIPGQISISTLGSDSSSNMNTSSSSSQPSNSTPPPNLIENLLQGLTGNLASGLLSSSTSSTGNATSASQPSSMNLNNSTQMLNSLMREAISLMDSNNTNDQRLNQPLREFLRMFGEDDDDYESSSSTASSTLPSAQVQNEMAARSTLGIFNTLFSSMTLGDMINLARGTDIAHVFERSRLPLQSHIKNYFKTNKSQAEEFTPTNEEHLNWLTSRFYTDVFIDPNGLHIDLNQFKLSNERINLSKSFENLMRHHLKLMIRHVFDKKYDQAIQDPTSTWSAVLYRNFQTLVQQLVTLSRFCLQNPDEQFTQIVTQKLRQAVMSQNVSSNTMFYSIFENFIRSQMQTTLSGVNMPTSSIENFVEYVKVEVKEEVFEPQKPQTSSNLSTLNSEDAKSTDSCKSFETASSTLSGTYMDVDESSFESKVKTDKLEGASKNSTLTSVTQSSTITETTNNSWKNLVPNDWMPIIEKDIQTQQNQSCTRPFSDAYCSGMPAKRRRILTSKNDLLTVNLFKKVLSRTLEKVQLKPNVNHEQLIEDSIDHSQLIDSFNTEFNTVINNRLRDDPDFNEIIKNEKNNNDEDKKENTNEKGRFWHSKKRFS